MKNRLTIEAEEAAQRIAKENNNPVIAIKFDRKAKTHEITGNGVTVTEMLLAYHAIRETIEEETGMSVDMVALAIMNEIKDDK